MTFTMSGGYEVDQPGSEITVTSSNNDIEVLASFVTTTNDTSAVMDGKVTGALEANTEYYLFIGSISESAKTLTAADVALAGVEGAEVSKIEVTAQGATYIFFKLPKLTAAEPENWDDHAATGFAGGSGTYEDPFQIATAAQLALVAKKAAAGQTYGVYYKQIADIDLAGNYWNGIGTDASTAFSGYYDGGNFEIKNLYIDKPEYSNVGLFGYIANADLINIRLSGVDVTGGGYVGALVGYNQAGDIANCHVLSGTVQSAGSYVGGLVGVFYPAGNNHNQLLAPDYIMASSSAASVSGSSLVGGLVGMITNRKGTVTSNSPGTGRRGNILIKDCYAEGNVTATSGEAGGLIGKISTVKNLSVESSYASGAVVGAGTANVGGLVGDSGFGTDYTSDRTIYKNNVVLSAALSGLDDSAVYGRITGLGQNKESALKVVLENNYALASMTVGDATVECDDAASYNGASLSAEKLAQKATWELSALIFLL